MRHPISVAIDAFLVDSKSRRLKPTTVSWYEQMLRRLESFLADNKVDSLEAVRPNLIRLFFLEMEEEGLKGSTQNGSGRSMRVFFNFCVSEGWIDDSPMKRIKLPRVDKTLLPPFTASEVQLLMGLCQTERDRALLTFMVDTGLRVQEVADTNVNDIDFTARSVYVRSGKGGKGRITFFGDSTHKALNRYFMELRMVPKAGSLFLSRTSKRGLTKHGIQMVFKYLRHASGIEHCSAHTCRRTFAIWNLRHGVNIYELQKMMGHSDIQVLQRYLDISDADTRAAHSRSRAFDQEMG